MDSTYITYATVSSFTLDTTVIVGGISEPCHVITFTSDFAKVITPQNGGPACYASIFKANLTDSDATGAAFTSSEKPPRVVRENKTASAIDGLAGYSIAIEKWDNGYSLAAGDLVIFEPATNNPPASTPVAEGMTSATVATTLIEGETSLRQLHRDFARATLPALSATVTNATDDNTNPWIFDINTSGKVIAAEEMPSLITAGRVGTASTYHAPTLAYDEWGRLIGTSSFLTLPRGYYQEGFSSYSSTTTFKIDKAVAEVNGLLIDIQPSTNLDIATTGLNGMAQSAALAGTVAVSSGTATVTGTGTSFDTAFQVGDVITTAGGQSRRIITISSATSITVESDWSSTESGVAYYRGGDAPNTDYYIYAASTEATDLILRSESFDAPSWTKSNITVTANSTTSPDGQTNGDTIASDGVGTSDVIFQSVFLDAGTQYTASVYLKADTGASYLFGVRKDATDNFATFINNSGGTLTLGGNTGGTYSITDEGGGWYRVTATFTTGAAGSYFFKIEPNRGNDSGSLSAWGALLETGGTASTYNPSGYFLSTRNVADSDALVDLTSEYTNYKQLDKKVRLNASSEILSLSSRANVTGERILLNETIVTTAVASVEFSNLTDPTFSSFEIELVNVAPATDNITLFLRLSNDGGSSFVSSAGAYFTSIFRWSNVATGLSGGSLTYIILQEGIGNNTNEDLSGTVKIYGANDASKKTRVIAQVAIDSADGNTRGGSSHAARQVAELNNAFQLFFTSGNITSGTFRLWGMR